MSCLTDRCVRQQVVLIYDGTTVSFFVDNLSQGLSTDDTGDIVTVNVAMYIGHAGPRKCSRALCAFFRSL